ncbi:hypothetical protein [Ureibacillus sp. GCM10028918]|uniref:hypothetical protein n=1 Tax=Ureibacillus sp. GCM10028918 TaxID=3273429 RepID=UPI00361C696B
MTLLLILVILVFVFFSLFLSVSKGKKIRKNFWTVKRIGIVIIVYIGLGLMALTYLSLASSDEYNIVSTAEVQEIIKDERQFYNYIAEKREVKFNEKYLVDDWSMELSSDEVTFIRESEDTYGRVFVLIDWRDDATSNKIYAKTYQIPHINSGIDLTKEITEDQFEFTGDQFIVKKPSPSAQQFTFNSISAKIEMLEWNIPTLYSDEYVVDNSVTGSTFLHLNVPNHVTIIDEGELRFYP